jgi:hypothetical protein
VTTPDPEVRLASIFYRKHRLLFQDVSLFTEQNERTGRRPMSETVVEADVRPIGRRVVEFGNKFPMIMIVRGVPAASVAPETMSMSRSISTATKMPPPLPWRGRYGSARLQLHRAGERGTGSGRCTPPACCAGTLSCGLTGVDNSSSVPYLELCGLGHDGKPGGCLECGLLCCCPLCFPWAFYASCIHGCWGVEKVFTYEACDDGRLGADNDVCDGIFCAYSLLLLLWRRHLRRRVLARVGVLLRLRRERRLRVRGYLWIGALPRACL